MDVDYIPCALVHVDPHTRVNNRFYFIYSFIISICVLILQNLYIDSGLSIATYFCLSTIPNNFIQSTDILSILSNLRRGKGYHYKLEISCSNIFLIRRLQYLLNIIINVMESSIDLFSQFKIQQIEENGGTKPLAVSSHVFYTMLSPGR